MICIFDIWHASTRLTLRGLALATIGTAQRFLAISERGEGEHNKWTQMGVWQWVRERRVVLFLIFSCFHSFDYVRLARSTFARRRIRRIAFGNVRSAQVYSQLTSRKNTEVQIFSEVIK